MTFLILKYGFKHNMSIYLVTYGIFRFSIEYLRADDRGQLVAGISPSQFWSIGMVLIGIALWILLDKFVYKKQKDDVETDDAMSTVEVQNED